MTLCVPSATAAMLDHAVALGNFALDLRHHGLADAVLSCQFDLILHDDRTRAVEPLELTALEERGELPETYPSSL